MDTSSIFSNSTFATIIGLHSTSPIPPFRSAWCCWRSRSSGMKLQAAHDDRGLRLDVFLVQHLPNLTRSQIQALNRSGRIRIDGRQDKAGYRIRGAECIELDLQPPEAPPLTPEQIPLQIYFEDRDMAVIE